MPTEKITWLVKVISKGFKGTLEKGGKNPTNTRKMEDLRGEFGGGQANYLQNDFPSSSGLQTYVYTSTFVGKLVPAAMWPEPGFSAHSQNPALGTGTTWPEPGIGARCCAA